MAEARPTSAARARTEERCAMLMDARQSKGIWIARNHARVPGFQLASGVGTLLRVAVGLRVRLERVTRTAVGKNVVATSWPDCQLPAKARTKSQDSGNPRLQSISLKISGTPVHVFMDRAPSSVRMPEARGSRRSQLTT